MNTIVSRSTGPKTEQGKAIASKNAIKAGIFSQGYLPWENQEAKQLEFDAMAQEWGVKSPTGVHFLRDIEQANLAQERLMYAERLVVEGAMQSVEVGERFAQAAGFEPVIARHFPEWYFLEDDGGNKKHAIYLDKVAEQAKHLRANYTDQYVAQVQARCPELHHYVMAGYQPSNSFALVLGKKYKQNVATLNLSAIGNELTEQYRFHLLWAQEPKRYQTIIDGLRAQKMLEVLDFDRSNRYLTCFQNRRIRALQGLDTLNRRQQEQFGAPASQPKRRKTRASANTKVAVHAVPVIGVVPE